MAFSFKDAFAAKLKQKQHKYEVAGVIGSDGTIYPLGSDTKVLSSIFELFTRPIMIEIARENGFELIEPDVQNHYPDFTLLKGRADKHKIAVDVKTTYVEGEDDQFGFTLGGYTSFIRIGKERKNIVFPFDEYAEHWVIGYVYRRVALRKAADHTTFRYDQLKEIPLPYADVRSFVQEKWRIASDRAGSGNTTNIGSIKARLPDFIEGRGVFKSEAEFLDYWRHYGRTDAERRGQFGDIREYREWIKTRGKRL